MTTSLAFAQPQADAGCALAFGPRLEGVYRLVSGLRSNVKCPGETLTLATREPGVVVISGACGGKGVARFEPGRNVFVGQFKCPAEAAGRDSDVVVSMVMTLEGGALTISARSRALDFTARYAQ